MSKLYTVTLRNLSYVCMLNKSRPTAGSALQFKSSILLLRKKHFSRYFQPSSHAPPPSEKYPSFLFRRDPGHRKYFVGMLQSAILQLVIFVQEILLAINLDLRGRLSWAAIFTPLYVLFVVSIAGCIFSCCIKNCSVEVGGLCISQSGLWSSYF